MNVNSSITLSKVLATFKMAPVYSHIVCGVREKGQIKLRSIANNVELECFRMFSTGNSCSCSACPHLNRLEKCVLDAKDKFQSRVTPTTLTDKLIEVEEGLFLHFPLQSHINILILFVKIIDLQGV